MGGIHSVSVAYSPPVPANTGTTPAVAGNPPRATGAGTVGLPTSLFLAFCPETPGGQRPSAPSGEVTPCQRVGILTKDAGSKSAAYPVSDGLPSQRDLSFDKSVGSQWFGNHPRWSAACEKNLLSC